MTSRSEYIDLGEQRLHCVCTGSGTKLILAFHGYNNDANMFLPFSKELGEDHIIVSVDMPHHGRSAWKEACEMQVDELLLLVSKLKEKYGVSTLSLLGYSMGGRICLKIAELIPEQVERIVLIAPDGLRFNWFYYFLTRTRVGKSIFKGFLTRPEKYMGLISIARKTGILDESRHKFAQRYIQTEAARSFLYNVWPAMCRLIPNTGKLKKAIRQHEIPIDIFMGKYDRIIPVHLAYGFGSGVPTVKVHVVEKGHRVFDADSMPLMAQCFL